MTSSSTEFSYIETERLILRRPEVADALAYVAIFSNPQNIEYDPEANGPDEVTVAKYEQHLKETSEGNQKGEKALIAVCLKQTDGTAGPVIGMGGFPWLPANANGRPGNTGVLIDSHYARKGYGTEALAATLDYGFDKLGFEVIEQDTEEINTPYRSLMRAMGFEEYGQRQDKPDSKGFIRWVYAVNKAQWKGKREQVLARRS